MKVIERQALVMHSAENMFALVNDVESYPQFLPGCSGGSIQKHGDNWIQARLELSKGGIHQHFITRNTLTVGATHRIDLELVEGPLSSLNGYWEFTPLDTSACRVNLHLKFSIHNLLLRMTVGPLFEHATGTMVDAFCKRADIVYGA